jgi:hypothetical protein
LSIGERVRWAKEDTKAYRQPQQSLEVGGGAVSVADALPVAHRLKHLMLILATPAVFLLSPGRANAILTYTIDQSDGDVIIQPNGALNRPPSQLAEASCGSGPSTFLQDSVVYIDLYNVHFPLVVLIENTL